MGIEDFIHLMRKRQGTRSLREYASSLGVSAAYLSDIYLGNPAPGPKIATALGYTCAKTKVVTVLFTRRRGA